MVEKTVYLHIGLHKAASSSIQATLSQASSQLEVRGYSYPAFGSIFSPRIINHSIPLYSLFCRDPYQYHINVKRGLTKEQVDKSNDGYRDILKRNLTNFERVVISGEDISVLHEEGLENCKSFFLNEGFALKVLILVRKPLAFVTSSAQERIRGGNYIEDKALFSGRSSQIAVIKQVFGDLAEFVPFEIACLHENGPVGFFLDWIGIADQEDIKFVKSNESMSNEAARVINYINRQEPLLLEGKLNPKRTLRDVDLLRELPGNKFHISRQEMKSNFGRLHDENEKLVHLLGSEFGEEELKGTLFLDQKSDGFYKFDAHFFEKLSGIVDKLNSPIRELVRDYFVLNPYLSKGDRKRASEIFKEPLDLQFDLSNHKTVDNLRDLALSVEKKDLKLAFTLMGLAYRARPNGKFIERKYLNYHKRLSQSAKNGAII